MHPLLARQLEQCGLAPDALPAPMAQLLRAVDEAYQQADTDRKRAESQAQYAEKLALVASRTDNAVTITDINGNIEWVNDGFTRISGYQLDQVIGKQPGSFLHGPDTDPLTIEFMQQQLARGEGYKTEIINYARDGRKYWVGVEMQPIYDSSGQLRNFMAIQSDITARKRVEEELQQAKDQAEAASRSKSEFLANMSHEIRTPLNGVIGMTELLLGSDLTQQQRRYVQIAKSSADALLVVINQILDFSKVEAGKLELESIDFDLATIVEEVAEMLAHRAASKGLELAYRIGPDVPMALRGDPARLRQVLINLVNNAVKFTHQGEVIVRVDVQSATDQQIMLRFSVTDSGVGIPLNRRDRLFKAFSQIDASTTRKYGGTGLGLVICKQIAELMGGQISVESAEGRGSTFWFTASFARRAAEPRVQIPNDLHGLRVLVVDDNASFRQILAEQLTSWGLRVAQAAEGQEALRRLEQGNQQQQPCAIAILDMGMPRMTGLKLAQVIRERQPGPTPAMILLTSLETPVTAEQSSGLCDSLTKPLRQSQLFDAIIRAAAVARGAVPVARKGDPTISNRVTAARPARILVAEDNEINQIVAREILTRAGFQCDVVSNGKHALNAIGDGHYDAVLMDCQMPEMDGFQAAAAIRQREAEKASRSEPVRWMPIIALTANALKGDREQCLAAGMDDYLCKPLDPRQLISTLNRMLAGSKVGDAQQAGASASSAASDGPAFDMDALLARCMGDVEFCHKLLRGFPREARQAVGRISDAVNAADASALIRAAHGLKGTAANLSATTVQRLAAELESLGKAGTLAAAERLLADLRREVDRCVAALAQDGKDAPPPQKTAAAAQ